MRKPLATILIVLISVLFLATCAKEYSFEGGIPPVTAVYTLSGAGGTCNANTVAGKYFAGTAVTANNYVEIEVRVTTIGSYYLNTSSINGVQFSSSGNFTATGVQKIIMKASGTPAATGTFTVSIPLGLGCSFQFITEKASVLVGGYTLAGAPGNCTSPAIAGKYTAGTALDATNTVTLQIIVTELGPYTLKTDTLNGISFSASGSFTTTGPQSLKLLGKGTPVRPQTLTFTPLTPTSNCTFSLNVENAQPLATYVLESGGGGTASCISMLGGTYTTGIPLNNSNTLNMRVFVTVPGNFTVATSTVNGIMFYYTGTFTTPGAQYILLQGSGIPITPGTFDFVPAIVGPHPLGGETCGFSVEVN